MFANFDKKKLKTNFGRNAHNYDISAPIQLLAAKKLCKIAKTFIQKKSSFLHFQSAQKSELKMLKVLDLGSGTGFIGKNLGEKINLFELDLAFEMLQQSSRHNSQKIQADFENLPFKDGSFDILISSFALHWITDFDKSFSKFFALLKPKGVFIFCLPCEGSLKELSAANIFNFNQFPKVEDLKKSLNKSGFIEICIETKTSKQTFESGIDALKSLKKIGANYSQKNNKIITKKKLAQFDNFCLKNFGTQAQKIEVSWAISYFTFSK
jgi:malonyl-CoA O-methyltransferase